MAKEYTKIYQDAGISEARYYELKYHARQYDKFLRICEDPEKQKSNAAKARMIEDAARAANSDLYPWIMENVTVGKSFEQLAPPCGNVQFHRARQRFFIELNARKT